jgi:hypothetical protein
MCKTQQPYPQGEGDYFLAPVVLSSLPSKSSSARLMGSRKDGKEGREWLRKVSLSVLRKNQKGRLCTCTRNSVLNYTIVGYSIAKIYNLLQACFESLSNSGSVAEVELAGA